MNSLLVKAVFCIFGVTGMALADPPPISEVILHSFFSTTKGASPYSRLAQDTHGNLYGTTEYGGNGSGVVFELNSSGQTVLYEFSGGADGANPVSGVTLDATGNLYGTTLHGGARPGVVYKVTPAGEETVLHTFTGTDGDGCLPYSGVVLDAEGNVYGTTNACGGATGSGVVYKLSPCGQETVLYTFSGGNDGGHPYAGVVFDKSGNLYGTTAYSGANGHGVVYKLTLAGKETVLHAFANDGDGANPYSDVTLDAPGNIYGTTQAALGADGNGVLYKLSPNDQETVLHTFTGGTDGAFPYSGVVLDAAGNLYGTTSGGGTSNGGVTYKVSPAGEETVLSNFTGTPDGFEPYGGLIHSIDGNLYGMTVSGGLSDEGAIYRLTLAGDEAVIFSFPAGVAGYDPVAGVALDPSGNVYGTNIQGGAGLQGAVYEISPARSRTVLHSFTGSPDGASPYGGVARDAAGNLYGTTKLGGSGGGTVYEITAAGTEEVLYQVGTLDTSEPVSGVTLDAAGNLYGTTSAPSFQNQDLGSVFKISAAGAYSILHGFSPVGFEDGVYPYAGVVLDALGNIYGTTSSGGLGGYGIVFMLSPSGAETILHYFSGGSDGATPYSGISLDSAGNLYGTTYSGGNGFGVVYKLAPSGAETIVYRFTGGADGAYPNAGVILDSTGNLYGTTTQGGFGYGVVYELSPLGEESVIYTFDGTESGSDPQGGVVLERESIRDRVYRRKWRGGRL